jgi:Phage integrase family
LARYAGLRVPSESHGLTWDDVNWEKRRLRVYAPKTDSTRTVPIVPELMKLLDAAWFALPERTDRTEHVVTLPKHNRHRALRGIVKKADIQAWDDLFQTLRRSAETWLAERWPQHAVSTWMGHSMRVSDKHYLSVPESLYDAASAPCDNAQETDARDENAVVERAAESAAVSARTTRRDPEKENGPATGIVPQSQSASSFPAIFLVDRAGIEPATHGFSVRCSTN